ncbi:MAG: L-threonylcarbamoyladenylate synthase [Pirellulaceae bacterium]|nr:L-threonylcarbamoyladenylate synthase [Pirellulaceae bacterium]
MTLMNTIVLDDISEAAAILQRGGLVAFPTETVFGLGADATNQDALEKLFAAKGRPSDNPLIVHIAEVEQWPSVARAMPEVAERLLARFAPGPLTVVLPKHSSICNRVTAGLDTVGLRIPDHPQARKLLAATGLPIAAPSANRSGMPSGTTWQTVLEDLDGRIDAVLRGSTCAIGIESTVVDCVHEPPRLLRPGAISLAELQTVAPEIIVYVPMQAQDAAVNSPGLRHPHYKPSAVVKLVANANEADHLMKSQPKSALKLEQHLANCAYCGLDTSKLDSYLGASRRFDSVEEYAHELYEFMRSVDRLGIQYLFCQRPTASGIGAALHDRLTRAAAPK